MRRWIAVVALMVGCSGRNSETPKVSAGTTEASFIEVPALGDVPSIGRMFTVHHPADDGDGTRPLIVAMNGGPGFPTSRGLLVDGIGPLRHPPNGDAKLEENTSSFTRFASLLFIDSRDAGFSYDIGVPGSGCSGIDDAVDHVRVVLRHLAMHPERRGLRVVLLGESWGGTRAIAMSHLLRHPEDAHDDAFTREVHDHFAAVAPITAEEQFAELVLIQPLALGAIQEKIQRDLDRTEPLLTEGACGFDVSHTEEWCAALDANTLDLLGERAAYLRLFPGLEDLALLRPDARAGVISRDREPAVAIEASLTRALGPLPAHDRYYQAMNSCVYSISDAVPPAWFVEAATKGRVFLTNARRDAQIRTKAIPAALTASGLEVHVNEGSFDVVVEGKSARVRWPSYDAGHPVALAAGPALAADVSAWLAER